MTVAELIARLQQMDPALEIAILDGFNGGGQPRTINLGPFVEDEENIAQREELSERADYSDINTAAGKPIVLMGYGCY